jgi:hypothetical protein
VAIFQIGCCHWIVLNHISAGLLTLCRKFCPLSWVHNVLALASYVSLQAIMNWIAFVNRETSSSPVSLQAFVRWVITLQHHHSPKLGWQRAVHHSPKHWILHHIYHIQGVIFSKHLISLRGAVYCSPDIFISEGLHWGLPYVLLQTVTINITRLAISSDI